MTRTRPGPIRIAGCAGGNTDRWDAIERFAGDSSIDVIIGDWLSESNMASTAAIKAQALAEGKEAANADELPAAYAKEFLQCFEPAIPKLAQNKIKLIVNAGASDTERLAYDCLRMVQKQGTPLRIAWIAGDDVTSILKSQISSGESGPITLSESTRQDVNVDFVFAQCYMGGWGIASALAQGADVVLCGRVADASPVVGAAAWWHGWSQSDYNSLARALIAGHLIECSGYATGGNFVGFKKLLRERKHINLGFPIAEIEADGTFTVSKEQDSGGCVTVESLTSQLVYEIQGPFYMNSDVVANLSDVSLETVGPDMVRVSGIQGSPPPPTTKVGITTSGGYQAEFHAFIAGLDVEEKCQWTEEQIRYAMGKDIDRFSTLRFHRVGSPLLNASSQDYATVLFRVFAQTKDPEILRRDVPNGLYRWCMSTFLSSCPALTPSNDTRLVDAKPYYNYLTGIIPQKELRHQVHCLFGDNQIVDIDPPAEECVYGAQPSYETENPASLSSFGEVTQAPLGSIVFGRSGDKGANCNVGLFVRHADEWDWLRSYLTTERIKSLLGPIEYTGDPIDRFEMPNIKTVHFLLHNHLDRGFNSSSSVDVLGKNTCEYLRSKTADIPKRFLERRPLE
ncbi:DUF1446 domain protein [Penicillium lividum]|nr:DUF1446 domain protein [Penicillium lividum]